MTELHLEQDIDALLNDVTKDVDEIIDPSNVVGDKIVIGDTTIIPLMEAGFGFGAGGGDAVGRGDEEGRRVALAEGTGGGGGVKPVAVIVVNPDGVQVTPVPGAPGGLEKLAGAIGDALAARQKAAE